MYPENNYRSREKNKRKNEDLKKRVFRKKFCRFCLDKINTIDYKDAQRLLKFITERGKIIPRRISGNCACHQRIITRAIKRARQAALLPFTAE